MAADPRDVERPPWSRHLQPGLQQLSVYETAPTLGFTRLHANECPEPWPREVMDAVAEVIRHLELGRYPESTGRSLRELLAKRHDCDPRRIVLGNGSDEVIGFLLTALAGARGERKRVVVPSPTFVMYEHMASVFDMQIERVPLTERLELDETAMHQSLAHEHTSLCFIARPNNPTGSLFDADAIRRLVARHPHTVFVIDEAYVAYAPGHSLWHADNPSNMVHMQTLSKIGLAGLRIGYCIADPNLAEALHKVRPPYNVSQTSIAVAETILTRFDHVLRDMIDRTTQNRARLTEVLADIPDAEVFSSAGNLVLVRLPDVARARSLCRHLADHGILVKDVSSVPRLQGCVRVSVGTVEELDRLQRALQARPRIDE